MALSARNLIDGSIADAIRRAAAEVTEGQHDDQFPIDVFQTGREGALKDLEDRSLTVAVVLNSQPS